MTQSPSKRLVTEDRSIRVYRPEAYGAAAAFASATDDTTAVQAAINAAVSAGGKVHLSRMYNIPAGGLTATGPVTITGIGGQLLGDAGTTALSGLICTSSTADCLTLQGGGSLLMDFAVINQAAAKPTAGRGLYLSGFSQGAAVRILIQGFWNNVETNGQYWTIDASHIYDPVNYGVFCNNTANPDNADFGITNSVLATMSHTWNPAALLHIRSGGGVRITGCKFNGVAAPAFTSGKAVYGIEVAVQDGIATGDMTVTGNSIANFTGAGIRIAQEGTTGYWTETTITGNNINSATGKGIVVNSGGTNYLTSLTISGNDFQGLGGASMQIAGVSNVNIGTNNHQNVTGGVVTVIGDGTGTVGGWVQSLTYAPQQVKDDGLDILQDWRSTNNNGYLDGLVDYRLSYGLNLTTVNTWTTLFSFQPYGLSASSTGGWFEFTIAGFQSYTPANGFIGRYQRTFYGAGTGAVPTVTAIGTDVTAGPGQFAVQFVATAGAIAVQVQIPTGATTAQLQAKASLTVYGQLTKLHKGA